MTSYEIELLNKITTEFEFDLSGKVILTECASGSYFMNPIALAKAGSEKIFLIAKDSKEYGLAEANYSRVKQLLNDLKLRTDIELVTATTTFERVDIVTNTGHVRPIDNSLLSRIPNSCVIPLMFESWEFRSSDIDIESTLRRGDWITTINESHKLVSTFRYLGALVVDILFDLERYLINNNVLLVGKGIFCSEIEFFIQRMCGTLCRVHDFSELDQVYSNTRFDIVIIADINSGVFDPGWSFLNLYKRKFAEGTLLVNLSGALPQKDFPFGRFKLIQRSNVRKGFMSLHAGDLGVEPVLRLFVASLKVASVAYDLRNLGYSVKAANQILYDLDNSFYGEKSIVEVWRN